MAGQRGLTHYGPELPTFTNTARTVRSWSIVTLQLGLLPVQEPSQ